MGAPRESGAVESYDELHGLPKNKDRQDDGEIGSTVGDFKCLIRDEALSASKTLSDSLREDFEGVADVASFESPDFPGRKFIEIHVTDEPKWRSEKYLRKLISPFGEILFHAYGDRESNEKWRPDDPDFIEDFFRENLVGTDLSLSDRIYVVAEQGRVQGFISTHSSLLEDGTPADQLMLIAVQPDQERTGLGKSLYKFTLEHLDSDVAYGVSHTPSAVRNGISVGADAGWSTYYCGHRNGDSGIDLTPDERLLVDKVQSHAKQQAATDDEIGHFQKGLPDEYISYGDIGIPPRRMEELRFRLDDPLRRTFEDLIRWQTENRPEHCIYGMLTLVRNHS